MSVVTENVSKPKSKRIFYFDALRALAIITVILFHVFKRTNGMVLGDYCLLPSLNWFINDILGVCCRCGVDIFLMLSGALSLGRVWDIKSFLGKRIPRIVGPFVFWGFILTFLLMLISLFVPFIFNGIDFNAISFAKYLVKAYLAKGWWFGIYWFFWMILGTYLIMPIFNKWLLHSDLKEAEYFLFFWLITCIFDFTINKSFPIKLSYFSGPIGMVVLGYYLRHTKRKLLNNPYFAILLMLIGGLSMIIISYLFSSTSETFYFDRYCFFMAIEVTGIFLLFKNFNKFNINLKFLKDPNGTFRKSIFSIAKYSYGIYLIHQFIMNVLVKLLENTLDFKLLTLVLILGSLFISWAVLALLNRVPYVNKVIGAK